MDSIPPLAVRSPGMSVRQIYEFEHGLGNGAMAKPMKANAANMTTADMIALPAIIASLKP